MSQSRRRALSGRRAPPAPKGKNVEQSAGVGWRPSFHDAGWEGGAGSEEGGAGGLPGSAPGAPSLPQPGRAPREEFPAWD